MIFLKKQLDNRAENEKLKEISAKNEKLIEIALTFQTGNESLPKRIHITENNIHKMEHGNEYVTEKNSSHV